MPSALLFASHMNNIYIGDDTMEDKEKIDPTQVLRPDHEGSYQAPPPTLTPPAPPKPIVNQESNKGDNILADGIVSVKEFEKTAKQIIVERVDVTNLCIIIIVGVCLGIAIVLGAKEVATALGGGLVGYLGKTGNGNK